MERRDWNRFVAGALSIALLGRPAAAAAATLEGIAVLPADTSSVGPTSGYLYPMLEGALTTDPDQRRLAINEFDLKRRDSTGRRWFYRLDAPIGTGQAIGDLTAVNDRVFLVIERDGGQGPTAQGFLLKEEVADLLNLADPHDIGGTGTGTFAFPFTTIESVTPSARRRSACSTTTTIHSARAAWPGGRTTTSSSSSGSTSACR